MLSISQPLAPMLKTGEAEAYLKHSNSSSNQQQAKFDDVGVLRRTCQRFFPASTRTPLAMPFYCHAQKWVGV